MLLILNPSGPESSLPCIRIIIVRSALASETPTLPLVDRIYDGDGSKGVVGDGVMCSGGVIVGRVDGDCGDGDDK